MRVQQISKVIVFILVVLLVSTHAFPQAKQRFVRKDQMRVNQNQVFVQGYLFLHSNSNQIDAQVFLKDVNGHGPALRNATVTINGVNIPETQEAGKYQGLVGVMRQGQRYVVNVNIQTSDRRVITSSGSFDSLLKLYISNIFPRQPDKIDVGDPVTVRWEFVPNVVKPVDLKILNLGTNGIIFQRNNITNTNSYIFPNGSIPKRQQVEISVETAPVQFPINQSVHHESFIKLFIKTGGVFNTFG